MIILFGYFFISTFRFRNLRWRPGATGATSFEPCDVSSAALAVESSALSRLPREALEVLNQFVSGAKTTFGCQGFMKTMNPRKVIMTLFTNIGGLCELRGEALPVLGLLAPPVPQQ